MWLPTMDLAGQFWVVLLPIAVFGMSHGGADPILIRALSATKRSSSALWLGGYLILMALTVAFIVWQPTLALVGFLCLSAWHFASTDRLFLPAQTPSLAGWLSGSLPIVGPMVGHPEQVAALFAWLLQQQASALVPLVKIAGYGLLLAWGALLAGVLVKTARDSRAALLMELGIVGGLLLALPPLLGFAFYFCAVHSMRHFLALLAAQRCQQPAFNAAALARRAAPATLGAIVLGLLAWWGLQRGGTYAALQADWLADGVRVVFWGLAVLTVPHALLVGLWMVSPKASRAIP
ncbi:Brp/Blh family beta-carotene 15,15'-dioxygenase [Halomonas cibimaris]